MVKEPVMAALITFQRRFMRSLAGIWRTIAKLS